MFILQKFCGIFWFKYRPKDMYFPGGDRFLATARKLGEISGISYSYLDMLFSAFFVTK